MNASRRAGNSSGLVRDLEILEAVAQSGPSGLGVTKIAHILGREKTQVSRALSTLGSVGIVQRDSETLAYRLGWKLHTLAARTFESHLSVAAEPALRKLTTVLNAASHLFVLRGGDAIAICSQSCDTTPHAWQWIDRPLPAPTTSPGRVLISHWDEESVRLKFPDKVLAGYNETHQMRTTDALLTELGMIRKRGYAILIEEFEVGWTGCSAPIFNHHNQIVAAINVEGPTTRLEKDLDRIARLTAKSAADLTTFLTQLREN